MRDGSRAEPQRLRTALALGCALLVGAPLAATERGATVTVTVTELRNAKGIVRACMTADETRFPKCRGVAGAYAASAEAQEGAVTFTFRDVKPGRYAIALLHDENTNGKADRALGMMPKEGFGFSHDAPVRMGPPAFGDAAFDVGSSDSRMTIRMRYLL